MDASLIAALAEQNIRAFWAIELTIGRTVRLLDGSGIIVISGQTFQGADANLGSMSGMAETSNEIATEEIGWSMSLAGVTDAGIAELIAALGTGTVSVSFGVANLETGTCIGAPEIKFVGTLEKVQETLAMQQQKISLEFSSAWSRLLENNQGQRLNGPFHELAWPGEKGLEYTHGLKTFQAPQNVYLGVNNFDSGEFNMSITQGDRP